MIIHVMIFAESSWFWTLEHQLVSEPKLQINLVISL